jgi:hypothetical protein
MLGGGDEAEVELGAGEPEGGAAGVEVVGASRAGVLEAPGDGVVAAPGALGAPEVPSIGVLVRRE